MMKIINEKLAPVNGLVAQYSLRTQVLALIGIEMFFIFLLWIIPPPITAPFDLGAFLAFIVIIVCILREITIAIKWVKYYILLHLFILILYLLVYEVIFNWIIKPGKKEQTLSIYKIILIVISCLVDGLLYLKWTEYRANVEHGENQFPDTITTDTGVNYSNNLDNYQDGSQNY